MGSPTTSIAAALVAAALLGVASVAQRRAALTVPTFGAGDLRLVTTLTRRPWWWAGTAAAVAGLGLQVLALALGPIIVVQCVLTSSIVATTVAEWLLLGHRPHRRSWTGMALTALGLAGLLAALNPTTGTGAVPSPAATLGVAACCVSVMAAAIAWSRHPGGHPPGTGRTGIGRVLALAACTGLGYGVTAVQLKSIGTQLASGPLAPLQHPALYVALVLGPLSILLSQHALQQGRLATAVVSLILVVDPLVGLTAGPLWFGERIDTGLVSLAAAAVCAVTLLAGVGLTQVGSLDVGPSPSAPIPARPPAARSLAGRPLHVS
jgi:drug/metabolite transporter (DMT)-like permease